MADHLNEEILEAEARGDYPALLNALQKRLAEAEKQEDNALEIANLVHERAGVYRDLGDYEKAFADYAYSREKFLEHFGPHHPDFATALVNEAGCYRLNKQYDKAVELFLDAIGVYERTLGKDHFLTLAAQNNLALVLFDQGKYKEALQLHEKTLSVLEEIGADLPVLATTEQNIANVLVAMKEYDQAEKNYKDALKIYEETVGPEHSLTAYVIHNLAHLYAEKKDLAKAREYAQKAEPLLKKCFGENSKPYQENQKLLAQLS